MQQTGKREKMYAVYLSDLTKNSDRRISEHHTRKEAEQAVKGLNAASSKMLGYGCGVPLYYIRRREDQ